MDEITVTFPHERRTVKATAGTTAAEAARLASLPVNMHCGGRGKCGKCAVTFSEGAPEPSPADRNFFSKEELAGGARLACRSALDSDAVIRIPEKSRLVSVAASKGKQVGDTPVDLKPSTKRIGLSLSPPSAHDPKADSARLLESLPPGTKPPDSALLRELPSILRKKNFHATVTLRGGKIIDVVPGAARRPLLGAAVDLGTTTIAARVFNLETGEEIGGALAPNPQSAYGADVASRATYISENKTGLKKLSALAMHETNRLLKEITSAAKLNARAIVETVLVGNPIMTQIFLGIDPGPIAVSPFIPAVTAAIDAAAIDVGLRIHKRGRLVALPAVAGYVGADAVAALLSALSAGAPLPALLIDFGTNAEILLVREDGVWACAAAAGPALEGAQLSCGMGAYPGAIDSVALDEHSLQFTVIGGASPLGLCGTGALDLLAALLRLGIIDKSGRIADQQQWPEAHRERFFKDEKGRPAFLTARAASGAPIALTQADVRQLQLARAAILGGAHVLLSATETDAGDLGSILLAGALGTFMKPETALGVGIIPAAPVEKIRFLGNAALDGARRALLSIGERRRAEKLAASVHYVELSSDPRFMKEFEQHMTFR